MNQKIGLRLLLGALMEGALLSMGCGDVPFILFDDDKDFTFVAPRDAGVDPVDSGSDIGEDGGLSYEDMDTGIGENDESQAACEPDTSAWNNPERIIALADIHGYLPGMRRILSLTGLINENDHWTGAQTVLVQLGDTIDRGNWDREVMDLLERLKLEARAEGGNVYILIGNHETDNVMLNFDYVTGEAFTAFDDLPYDAGDSVLSELPEEQQARAAAFRPGGVYATILAGHKMSMILGGILFTHAGLSPEYADYGIYKLNEETRDWMLGEIPRPGFIKDEHGPIRTRHYGYEDEEEVDCEEVGEVLDMLCAKRMVVGHTIQDNINSVCDGLVYRIDVGMYMEKRVGAIEIKGHDIRFIEEFIEESDE